MNNKMKDITTMQMRTCSLFVLFLLCCLGSYAQQHVITGVVTERVDEKTLEPILGANVVLVNAQNRYLKGTVTDLDDNYTLQVPDNAQNLKIRVSYVGMNTVTVKYTGQTHQNFELVGDDAKQLQQVTVTAQRTDRMGISQLQQTSSVQSLNVTEIIEQSPVSSLDEALQGQISGLDINLSGDPGARSSIRIRGTSTLDGDAEPLIVVDGVPYDVTIDDGFSFQTANEEDFGALLNIAPSNIESVDVLKDAAATAIYGSKGANGVLLINTKRGSRGKTQFSFSTKFTAKWEPASIPLLDGAQYTSLMQDALWNAANAKGISSATNEMDMLFNQYEITHNTAYRYYDEYNVDTDWLDAVKQNAYITDNNFSMNGGGEKATYRFALGYYDEMGTTRGTGLNRFSSQLKITYNFSDRLRVHTDLSFSNTQKEANVTSDVRSVAMSKMPNLSPYWIDDDTKLPTAKYFVQEEDFQGNYADDGNYNPVAMVNLGYNKTTVREEKMTVTLDYEFPFHLRFTGWVSLNMRTNKNKKFLPQEATGVLWTSSYANRATDATSDYFSLQSESKLLYNNTFNNKHAITGTLLFRTQQSQSFSETASTYGNASTNLSDPIVGSVVASSDSGESETRSVSLIGQAVYSYDDRYVAKASLNYEGNSAMGAEHRFGSYPAFGLAWNLDKEHFWSKKFHKILTEAKIRASLGWSGKAPSGSAKYYGAYASLGQYVDMQAIAPTRMQLDKLKWQSTREIDLGVDLRLFDKLSLTFDYYDKYTSDLLLSSTSLPVTTGYSSIAWINSGELSNKGFEFRAEYQILKTKDWQLSVNANVSRNINTVEKLPSTYSYENYTFGNGNYALRIVEGAPIGAFYGYRYLGVYQNTEDTYALDSDGNVMYDYSGNPIVMRNGTVTTYPGDAKYEDINHDGVINENDIVYLGNANPKLVGGGGFRLGYKGFTLTTFFYGRYGQKIINKARMNLESMYGTGNQSTAVLHRWRTEGDETDIPRALYGMGYNYLGSDRFVEDASFLRLKTISLSYSVPKKFLQKLNWGVSLVNIFVTGYDLFTWTNYTGQDPEVSLPSATTLVTDDATTPVSKRVAFGLTINF